MNIETKWLEDLVALAATRSFSQAAERRFVTQPAFSRRIRSLENCLGLTLVNRAKTPVELTEAGRILTLTEMDWRPGAAVFSAMLEGRRFTVQVRAAADGFVIRHRAVECRVRVLTPVSAVLYKRLPPKKVADTAKLVLSPMPGLVVTLDVTVGQEVKTGETVAIIEAMKMQNIIRAERDGVVKAVGAKQGDSVAADEVLVEFA